MDLVFDGLIAKKFKYIKQLAKSCAHYKTNYSQKIKEYGYSKTKEVAVGTYAAFATWNYKSNENRSFFSVPKFRTFPFPASEENANAKIKLKAATGRNGDDDTKAFLKSQPVPVHNDGPVKVAVGDNFDDIVYNNGRDTFLQFYAPWCMHCKMLAPVYEELGEKMKDEEIEIVKIDATSNEFPKIYDVHYYPSLFWLPKDAKKKPIRYKGGRDLEDFINFIAENATIELKGYDRSGKPKMNR